MSPTFKVIEFSSQHGKTKTRTVAITDTFEAALEVLALFRAGLEAALVDSHVTNYEIVMPTSIYPLVHSVNVNDRSQG